MFSKFGLENKWFRLQQIQVEGSNISNLVERNEQVSFLDHWQKRPQKIEYMGVSKNRGTPKLSILIRFSIINHPFWGTPYFWKHPYYNKTGCFLFGQHTVGSSPSQCFICLWCLAAAAPLPAGIEGSWQETEVWIWIVGSRWRTGKQANWNISIYSYSMSKQAFFQVRNHDYLYSWCMFMKAYYFKSLQWPPAHPTDQHPTATSHRLDSGINEQRAVGKCRPQVLRQNFHAADPRIG